MTNNPHSYILPNPFFLGSYNTYQSAHNRIINVGGASENASLHDPSNLLKNHAILLPEISFISYPDSRPNETHFLDATLDMQKNTIEVFTQIMPTAQQIVVLGGDHTVSIGTGAGLANTLNTSKVGLIYVDAHGDANTPETSATKSVYGYPAALNCGFGHPELLAPYNGNFIKKITHIGFRDVDEHELTILKQMNGQVFSCLDIEQIGMKLIVDQTLEYMSDCDYLWLSIDIDALDPIYFQNGETDVPVSGGLTPRELLYLTSKVEQTGKLKVTEIVQINDIGKQTPIISLASRLCELALGIGQWRYGAH